MKTNNSLAGVLSDTLHKISRNETMLKTDKNEQVHVQKMDSEKLMYDLPMKGLFQFWLWAAVRK